MDRYRILYDVFANTLEPNVLRFRKGQVAYGYLEDGYAWLTCSDEDAFFYRVPLSHVRRMRTR